MPVRRIAALVTVVLLAACGGTPEAAEPPEPLRLLVAGDSLAEGYYATTVDQGFASLLAEDLDADPTVVGVAGARAFRIAAAVEDVTAGEEPYDVVVLEAGANDVGVSSQADWRAGYERLLAAVTATSPNATVVCLGPWESPRRTRAFDTVVRRLCRDHVYLPLSDLYAEPGSRGPAGTSTELGTSDDFHPNGAGHAAIADRILEDIHAG